MNRRREFRRFENEKSLVATRLSLTLSRLFFRKASNFARVQFTSRLLLLAVAYFATGLAFTSFLRHSTDWEVFVRWDFTSNQWLTREFSITETWVRSMFPGFGWTALLFAFVLIVRRTMLKTTAAKNFHRITVLRSFRRRCSQGNNFTALVRKLAMTKKSNNDLTPRRKVPAEHFAPSRLCMRPITNTPNRNHGTLLIRENQ